MNVSAWLRGLGLEKYLGAFEDNDVDARTLRLLTEQDLADIGVNSVGHRRRLSEAIAVLRNEAPAQSAGDLIRDNHDDPAAQAVTSFAVDGERAAESTFDAQRGPELAPMLGRDLELALLLERWAQAQGGEGQALLLVGEAGIGKSRIVRALLDACAAHTHWRIRWQCSAHHAGSALWPVIRSLGHNAGLSAQDSTDVALDKLEALAGQNKEAAALYAALLGLDAAQRYGPLEMTPQMLRERTLELLVEQLIERAAQRTLLLVVEDTHWIDPTTLDLLNRCLERTTGSPILILITSRPDNQPALGAHPHVTQLSLSRLSRASVQAMVVRLGGESLQAHTRAAIVAQSEGVPLFVEELTKAILETGEATVPASLHGSLMARLDRIPEAKEVAQIAACIGREFDLAMLQAVAEQPEAVGEAIDKLAAAELIFRRGDKARPRFTFKHALVQEAAYESLLRGKRQIIHARILDVLEGAGRTDVAQEILAHHAERALQLDKAIGLWSAAGTAALGKSAYAEAARYLTSAIELVQAQPQSADRRGRELQLHVRLALANMAYLGFPAQATKTALTRADELLDADHDNAHYYPVQYGLWAGGISRAEFDASLRLARKVLATAQADGTDQALLFANRILASSHMYLGEFACVRSHFDRALQFFDPTRKRGDLAKQFSVDPGAAVHCCYGFSLAIMGFGVQSRDMLERAREIGLALEQASAKAYTSYQLAITGAMVRDPAFAKANAEVATDLAVRHGLPMYRGTADILLGWAVLEAGGSPEEAVIHHEHGLAELTAMGSHVYVPIYMAWQATALAAAGRHADALHMMERAVAENETNPQGWGDAELWRLRGDLFLHGPQLDHAEASRCFESAQTIARARGAKLWELRASVSLARLWAGHGERAKALALLIPIYDWFTEGFDTVDLVEARALLSELGHVGADLPTN